VGKEITFTTIHSLTTANDEIPRDLGRAEINGHDLTTELLRAGWAKLKEIKREASEDDLKKRDVEAEAKAAGRGIWNPHGQQARTVHYTMPVDSAAFVAEWRGKSLDAIVEQVRDGSTVRVRLLMPDGDHQMANIALAGVKCPRTSARPGEPSEPFAEEAKYFTESRLLQRPVKVQILSLPNATATPFQQSANMSGSTSASIFIGNVLHPVGNIAEFLVGAGLARVVDWHAGMLSKTGGMDRLRTAERAAKEKRVALYATSAPAAPSGTTPTPAANDQSREFDGTVVRVWSGDQISVIEKETGKERRLQLSSTRSPKLSDPRQAAYAQEAREFLRKKLIGKHVKVHIDFIRPAEGDFEEKDCATIRYGNQGACVSHICSPLGCHMKAPTLETLPSNLLRRAWPAPSAINETTRTAPPTTTS